MKHIISFSGGAGSWGAARRVADEHGTDDMLLVFTDTLIEDEDLYRFLEEAAADIGAPLVKLADGRTPWEVFKDVRMIGNTRIDPCSRILKRDLFRKWLEANYAPDNCVVYLGIDWTEVNRYEGAKKRWDPWQIAAPLCLPPYISKKHLFNDLKARGIKTPRLYDLGFPHNNCGGFCVKAGQTQFRLLLSTFPERFEHHMRKEEEVRQYLDKDVAILRDRRGGTLKPLTLAALKARAEEGLETPLFDWGGCGCFV